MAAGGSKRMEDIKQLLPWKDSNFLLETIKTVKKSDADSIHVILGSEAEKIIDACNLLEQEVKISINPNWSNGLGDSIAFAVKNLVDNYGLPDGVLICLSDQPLLSSDYLNALIESFNYDHSKISATQYTNAVGVPALFPKLLFPHLVHLEGDQGAKDFLNKNIKNIIRLDAGIQSLDIDTKFEYQQLIKQTITKT